MSRQIDVLSGKVHTRQSHPQDYPQVLDEGRGRHV